MPSFKDVRVPNIYIFSLIWQGSEYGSGCNCERVLNIPGFQVCLVFVYENVTQGSEYEWIMPYGKVLNIPGQRFTEF